MEFLAYPVWKNTFGQMMHQCDKALLVKLVMYEDIEFGWRIERNDDFLPAEDALGPVTYCPMCGGRLPND